MPPDFNIYQLFRRWREVSGETYSQMIQTPLTIINRYVEYNDIEESLRKKSEQDGQTKR